MLAVVALSILVMATPTIGYWVLASNLSLRRKLWIAAIALVILIALPIVFLVAAPG